MVVGQRVTRVAGAIDASAVGAADRWVAPVGSQPISLAGSKTGVLVPTVSRRLDWNQAEWGGACMLALGVSNGMLGVIGMVREDHRGLTREGP